MKEMISQYTPLWEKKGGIYSLAQGIVYWSPPETCNEALQKALQGRLDDDDTDDASVPLLHTYGPAQGIPQLTRALERKIDEENQLSNHHVMVTVGANQAYMNCVLTLLDQNTKAVVFQPYYFNHVMAIQMTCGDSSVVVGPTSEDGIPNVEWLEETLRNQKGEESKISLVTVVNPGNPTGVSLSKDHLQRIVDLCQQYGVWLVLDCTYEYFTTPSHHQPLATFSDSQHVIHIFSFSKSYSLAGYRCGYLVLHKDCSDVWQNLLKVQDTIPIAPPRISQVAALGALKAGKEWVYQQYQTLDPSREKILDALSCLPQTIGGSGAMYVMGKLPEDDTTPNPIRDDVLFCRQLVQEWGVAVIPGSFCGSPGWIRVCYANLEPSVCAIAAQRLKMGIREILRH